MRNPLSQKKSAIVYIDVQKTIKKYQQRIKQGTHYLSKVTRFENIKGVIRSRKSKKDGQYIGQKKKDKH
jgi:virulence-associated protein VapD